MTQNSKDEKRLDKLIYELKAMGGVSRNQYTINLLTRIGRIRHPRAEKILTDILKNEDDIFRQIVAFNLGKIGTSRSVGFLISALFDKSEFVRAFSARALGRIGGQSAGDALAAALKKEKSSYVRSFLASALGDIADKRYVGQLIFCLKNDEDISVRQCAASALGEIGDTSSVEPLIDALEKDVGISDVIIRALGKIGDPRATGHLIKILKNEDSFVREATKKSSMKTTVYFEDDTTADFEYLVDINKGLFRMDIAKALGRIGSPEAVRPLLELVGDDEHWEVSYIAIKALRNFKTLPSFRPLLVALKDKDKKTRFAAATTLKMFKWEPQNNEEEFAFRRALKSGKNSG